MLERLFGSQTRLLLLRLFLLRPPGTRFFVREMSRNLQKQINAVRRELSHLEETGILKSCPEDGKKYFMVNNEYYLYSELRNLLLKSHLRIERSLVRSISESGTIYYFILTGIFLERRNDPVDMLLVGDIDRQRLKILISQIEKQVDQEMNYTVLSLEEFQFRQSITDKFLVEILNNPKITVIDKLKNISRGTGLMIPADREFLNS